MQLHQYCSILKDEERLFSPLQSDRNALQAGGLTATLMPSLSALLLAIRRSTSCRRPFNWASSSCFPSLGPSSSPAACFLLSSPLVSFNGGGGGDGSLGKVGNLHSRLQSSAVLVLPCAAE